MKRLVSLVAVGCVLALASPAGAALHLTSHQRSQLRTWYARVQPQFSALTADVSNLNGQPVTLNSGVLCGDLVQSTQTASQVRNPPVATVKVVWRSAVVNLNRGANDCEGGSDSKANKELAQGRRSLAQVVKELQAAGAAAKIPGPATGDVSIASCTLDPNDDTTADVAGTIINHTGVSSDYFISVNILQGSVRIGSAQDSESNIGPGQTSTWSTFGSLTGGNGGAITCPIVSVERTPSSSQ